MEDRLQKFARLVEIGNFTRAARALHISQPALSIAVDKLEQELGAKLLIRDSRHLSLTEAGKAAHKAAIDHQNINDQLRTTLEQLAKKRPSVTIGMTDSVAALICQGSAFDQLEASADVTIIVNNSRYLREAVEQRQIDLAYVVDDGSEHSNLFVKPAGTEELLLVCHPSLEQSARTDLAHGRLRNFISYDKPSTTYRHIQRALRESGVKPHITLFSTSPDVMLSMVLRGKGTAALPRALVASELSSHDLSMVTTDNIVRRPISSISLRGKKLPANLGQFRANIDLNNFG